LRRQLLKINKFQFSISAVACHLRCKGVSAYLLFSCVFCFLHFITNFFFKMKAF